VQYGCSEFCGTALIPSIASFNITSYIPEINKIEDNGSMEISSGVAFNSTVIVQESNMSETIA